MTRGGDRVGEPISEQGAHHGHIQGGVPALCPVWDQNISWPGVGIREEGIFFLSWGQVTACSHLEEVVPEVVVAGYPLNMGATHYIKINSAKTELGNK